MNDDLCRVIKLGLIGQAKERALNSVAVPLTRLSNASCHGRILTIVGRWKDNELK